MKKKDWLKLTLKDSNYLDENGNLKQNPFKFMLGHESLILNLPVDVEEYLSEKKTQKKEIPKIEDLKQSFIERVNNFSNGKKIELNLNCVNLSKFIQNKNCVKCEAKCPLCSVKITCTFDSSWKISNYTNHIVLCAQKTVRLVPPIERANPSAVLLELHTVLP